MLLIVGLFACSPAVSEGTASQQDIDALVAQVEALTAQVNVLQEQLGQVEQPGDSGQTSNVSDELAALGDRVSALEGSQAALGDELAALEDLVDDHEAFLAGLATPPTFQAWQETDPTGGSGSDWETIGGAELTVDLGADGAVWVYCRVLSADTYTDVGDDLRLMWLDGDEEISTEAYKEDGTFTGATDRYFTHSVIQGSGEISVSCQSIGITWAEVELLAWTTSSSDL